MLRHSYEKRFFLYFDHNDSPQADFPYTVKLGYNDHGYNEFTAITHK